MSAWAPWVYSLCLLTSVVCVWLLIRSYLRNRTRLLLWSAVCFVLLALNNLFVVLDLVLLPSIDFTPLRAASSLLAIATLLYGFIWELD
jgi:hypothetical protein